LNSSSLFCSKSYCYTIVCVIVTVTLSLKNKRNNNNNNKINNLNKNEVNVTVILWCVLVLNYLFWFLEGNIMSASNKRKSSRSCKRNSGQGKYEVIRINGSVRHDLQFIKGFVGIASNVPDG